MAKPSISIEITGNSRGARRAIRETESSMERFGRTAGKTSKLAGKAFAAIGVAAGVAGVALAKSAITAASDLNETVSKTEAILGDAAGAVIDWSKTTANAFGISQTEALDMASAYSGALKNIGELTEDEAAATSQKLVGLTADLGSFFNKSNEEVQTAIASALTGEFEPLKKFNVIVNDAMLKQKALELGVYDGTGALDAQTKQMVTLALITEQTADAQGDFTATSGSMANQQKRLGAQVDDLKTRLGAGLLPVVQTTLGWMLDNMPAFQAAAETAFNRVMAAVEPMRPMFEQLVNWVVDNWPQISEVIIEVLTVAQDIIVGFVELVTAIWERWGDEILLVVTTIWNAFYPIVSAALGIIRDVIATVTALIKGDWDGVWNGILGILEGVWDLIKGVVSGSLLIIETAIDLALEGISTVFSGVWDGIEATVTGVLDAIVGAIQALGGRIKSAATGAFDGLIDAIPGSGLVGGLFDAFHSGGVVPGRPGQERLVLVEAGERILTREQQAGGGGGGVTIGNVTLLDGRDFFDELDRRVRIA